MTRASRREFLEKSLGLLAIAVTGIRTGGAQALGQGTRTVEGAIVNSQGKPCANAIVYLQDQKSQEIRTYITPANGKYRFTQLSMDTDYQLWARFQGAKSKTRSISSFSSKPLFVFDLKVEK